MEFVLSLLLLLAMELPSTFCLEKDTEREDALRKKKKKSGPVEELGPKE
jgi:hypothetical protein